MRPSSSSSHPLSPLDDEADGGVGVPQRVDDRSALDVPAVHVVHAQNAIVHPVEEEKRSRDRELVFRLLQNLHSLELSIQEAPFVDGGDVDGLLSRGAVDVVAATTQVQAQVLGGPKTVLPPYKMYILSLSGSVVQKAPVSYSPCPSRCSPSPTPAGRSRWRSRASGSDHQENAGEKPIERPSPLPRAFL